MEPSPTSPALHPTDLVGSGADPEWGPAEQTVADDLRRAFLVEPDAATAQRHVAAMVVTRQALLSARAGAGATSGTVTSLAAHRSRKALAAVGVAGVILVATAGAAAANRLPDPIQRVVASVGRPIGLHLPEPSDAEPGVPTDGNDPAVPSSSTPTLPPDAPTSLPVPATPGPDLTSPGGGQGEGPSASTPPTSQDQRSVDPKSNPEGGDPKGGDGSSGKGNHPSGGGGDGSSGHDGQGSGHDGQGSGQGGRGSGQGG